jgi:signal transduction histidine kinase
MASILRRRPAIFAIVLATLFWLSLVALAVVLLWRGRDQALESARLNNAALVQVLDSHTARTFQTVDLSLAGVADALNFTAIRKHDERFRETLRARLQELPHVRAIFVVGPDGYIIHDTDYPQTPDVSLADREYVRRHREDPGLVRSVSAPLESRAELGWFLAVSRRVGRAGKFEGIVVAAVKPDYFAALYQRLALGPGHVIALFHESGQMIARYPPKPGDVGKSFAGGRLFTKASQQGAGSYTAPRDSLADRRLVTYARMEDVPLLVSLYQEEASMLYGWRRSLWITVAALAFVLLLAALSTVMYLRHANLASRQRQRQVQRDKLEALGRLTGGTAHDFANLLGVVGNSLDLVARLAPTDAKVLEAVAIGKRAVSSGAKLIDQMLAFAKNRALRLEMVDVNAVIASRAGLLRHAAGSGVTVSFDLAANLWSCRTDETQLEMALVNLIANSRDAMQSKGSVVIRTSNEQSTEPGNGGVARRVVCVTVQDDGPGMTEEVREHLFEPFFTTKGEAGHGFGLSQIYGFMRQTEGDIRIDSAPGEGTSVHLAFPVVEASPAAAARPR